MGGLAIGLSFFATYSSTNSFVGFSGQSYAWGAAWLWLVPFIVGFTLLSWLLVAPRLRLLTESLDSLTIPDFIGFRFRSTASRLAAAVIVLFASLFYMTAVFKGIGNLLEAFLEIPYESSILLVFLIVMLYTAVGGFISVVKTDTVQGVVMIAAAVLLFAGATRAAGGVETLFMNPDPSAGPEFSPGDGGIAFPLLLGVLFSATVKTLVEPRQLSRFYALNTPSDIRVGIWVSGLSFALVYTLLTPIGLYARRILPPGISESDLVVPTLLRTEGVFSDGASAFLLLAMVAAAMSSLDSVLLVMASTAERDVMGVFRRRPLSEGASVRSTRLYVVLFAFLTMLMALRPPGGIVTLTALSGAVYATCFCPALLLGLYWRRGNGAAVMSSFAAGLLVLFSWRLTPLGNTIHEVFPAVLLSLLVFVAVAVVTPPRMSHDAVAHFE